MYIVLRLKADFVDAYGLRRKQIAPQRDREREREQWGLSNRDLFLYIFFFWYSSSDLEGHLHAIFLSFIGSGLNRDIKI